MFHPNSSAILAWKWTDSKHSDFRVILNLKKCLFVYFLEISSRHQFCWVGRVTGDKPFFSRSYESISLLIFDYHCYPFPNMFEFCLKYLIRPILYDRLKEKILKPWKGALSIHFRVFPSVRPSVRELQGTLFGIGNSFLG